MNTIFNAPGLSQVLQFLCYWILRAKGWTITGLPPKDAKYVMVTGPHTSNWDFPYMMAVVFSNRMNMRWMGKHTLFPVGLGWLVRWLGGVPVTRHAATDIVAQTVAAFELYDEFRLLVAPEGSRSKVAKWKTGFYRIARDAGVPIYLTFVDYGRREVCFGPSFQRSDDIDQDMKEIRASFAGLVGRRPELCD